MANSFELAGTVRHIFDLQTFNSGFTKREFVLEVEDGKFTQMVKIECLKDKTALLDSVSEGDEVVAHFNIRGNEYKERFFVNLVAWKIESAGGGKPSRKKKSSPSSLDEQLDREVDVPNDEDADEIPF